LIRRKNNKLLHILYGELGIPELIVKRDKCTTTFSGNHQPSQEPPEQSTQ